MFSGFRVQSQFVGLFEARRLDVSFGQSIEFGGDWCLIGRYAVHGEDAGATHKNGQTHQFQEVMENGDHCDRGQRHLLVHLSNGRARKFAT